MELCVSGGGIVVDDVVGVVACVGDAGEAIKGGGRGDRSIIRDGLLPNKGSALNFKGLGRGDS